ncbi:hypothetical protein EXIGLDRAFT_845457 [Exidia glandulosa HHB12029]|uniref:CCHC-type domain-containing protein n=1 Tax=Exidia glandulosa HHB12029 TaxID=1314781 RepID=A0A165BF88_EXIGL|nr:hypothetical protein EXIGLDRAFT_845457 [Exidia glandulosa HHB12029]
MEKGHIARDCPRKQIRETIRAMSAEERAEFKRDIEAAFSEGPTPEEENEDFVPRSERHAVPAGYTQCFTT